MFIDTHAHLNDEQFVNDLEEVLIRAKEANVGKIITVGYDLPSSEKAVDLAARYENIYAVVGIHPDEAKTIDNNTYQILEVLTQKEKVVGIGETGLDYYWDSSPRSVQQEAFRQHIRLANKLNLPVVVHDREAHGDVLRILQEEKPKKGILHCFSGSKEMAEECVKLGLYISFAGPVTFKNAKKTVEVASAVPLERILIETDCPYLAPHPLRGKRNQPAHVILIAEKLAEIRSKSLQEIEEITKKNAKDIFSPFV